MENKEIFIPLMSWLIGGSRIGGSYNIYTAYLGTDPLKGAIGGKIFNYRIWIEKNDEHELLKAAVYYGANSFECQNEEDLEVSVYELEEDSRELIKNWITEKYNLFLAENS